MRYARLLYLAGLACSIAFAAVQLRRLAGLARELKDSALSSGESLTNLAQVQKAQLARLRASVPEMEGEIPNLALPAPAPAEAARGPQALFDTKSLGRKHPAGGRGVLTDSSGRRFETPPEGLPSPSTLKQSPGFPAAVKTRNSRTRAILLGTAGISVLLLLAARRKHRALS